MTLRTTGRNKSILLVLIVVLVLVACSSSNEKPSEPQPDQAAVQATEVSSSGSGEASLSDLIVGSWLDTSPNVNDLLDFLPDGRFFMDSGVDVALSGDFTYEVGGDKIIVTDHRYTEDNTSSLVVGDITENSMTLLENPWSGGQVTFRKLQGADNLPVEILGLWLLEGVESPQADGTQTDVWFGMMAFDSDDTFLGGDTGTTYQILSNSAIALLNPTWDQSVAIRVHEISGDKGSFQFEIWDPPVLYSRHQEDERLKAKLVGVWGDAFEFAPDGRVLDNADKQVYSYRIYDNGTLLFLRGAELVAWIQVKFKSDNELYWCYGGRSESGALRECGEAGDTVLRRVVP